MCHGKLCVHQGGADRPPGAAQGEATVCARPMARGVAPPRPFQSHAYRLSCVRQQKLAGQQGITQAGSSSQAQSSPTCDKSHAPRIGAQNTSRSTQQKQRRCSHCGWAAQPGAGKPSARAQRCSRLSRATLSSRLCTELTCSQAGGSTCQACLNACRRRRGASAVQPALGGSMRAITLFPKLACCCLAGLPECLQGRQHGHGPHGALARGGALEQLNKPWGLSCWQSTGIPTPESHVSSQVGAWCGSDSGSEKLISCTRAWAGAVSGVHGPGSGGCQSDRV